MKDSFVFSLNFNAIKVHKSGTVEEYNEFTVKAPSRNNLKYTAFLKQAFFRAIKDSNGGKSDEASQKSQGNQDIDSKAIIYLLLSSGVDIAECLQSIEYLMTGGCGEIGNGVKMDVFHIQQIHHEDLDRLLGEFIGNFLLPSWMTEMPKS